MAERPECARREWQDVAWYAITWGGWIGMLFAFSQCQAQIGGQGPQLVIDDHRYGICWPKDQKP